MSEVIRLRCSALPLAFRCPGSVRQSDLPINDTSEAALLGTAAHKGLETLVERGAVDWHSVPALAKRYQVDEDELRFLLSQGTKLWAQVKDSFPNPLVELELSHEGDGWELTGHADILGRGATAVHVGDWKSGYLDGDYREQILGYCGLALLDDRSALSASAGVLWLRELEYEHHSMQRTELDGWVERIETKIVGWDGTYRPGPHCGYCHRSHECPARNALARRDVAALANVDLTDETLSQLTNEQWINLVEMAADVSKIADRVRGLARERVLRHGDISDGKRRLTVVTEERRSLDPIKAFPVLTEAGFGDEDMAQVISMSASKAEDVVAKRAPRGKGAAAVRQLREQLEAAEAIQVTQIQKLVQRRA